MSLKELNRAEQESRLGKGRRTNAEGGIGAMGGAGRHRANSEVTVFLVADNQLLREVMARLFQKRGGNPFGRSECNRGADLAEGCRCPL